MCTSPYQGIHYAHDGAHRAAAAAAGSSSSCPMPMGGEEEDELSREGRRRGCIASCACVAKRYRVLLLLDSPTRVLFSLL